jgi:RluA family pseudouridine synthase
MLSILFENDDILAIDKPEGLASIPEGAAGRECLLSTLNSTFPDRCYAVHRLDKEVSGVILFARSPAAHQYLNAQFSSRAIGKSYLALTHGVIVHAGGVIDKPIRQFGSGRMAVDLERGKPCATEFQVAQRFESHTLVRAHPFTGRRHQIRVHFYSIGHPIAGDMRYGDRAAQRSYPRLMLHAEEITFRLLSGEEMTVSAPIPDSFRAVLQAVA